ncbi:RNA-binding S4 domain-containing protein [Nocardioides pocheonensis]|jgi:ribosome-associated protein|uniref:RNA-binding S4 domain-containing protein n=1 Tax=Nocardioides pocheonensis TaxID=661485 RepID=A0A3N0GT08_9ACTN|nr:RNA-binding S4 domain-containing protein [Nocardioides pocheonensis]RNM15240.1 RNA-binding S4 domain-containing protein [Nocardioides pocheonensis]
MGQTPEPRTVEIRDASIRLGQLLKLADLVDDGSEAKVVLLQGLVEVNGAVETRRGRQLVPGDVVSLAGQTVGITSRGH